MNENLLYILAFLILIALLVTIYYKSKSKSKVTLDKKSSSQLVIALGGVNNISECEVKISRINLVLDDVSKANLEEIKSISQCGLMVVGNKIQLILKDNSEKFKEVLNDLEKSGYN